MRRCPCGYEALDERETGSGGVGLRADVAHADRQHHPRLPDLLGEGGGLTCRCPFSPMSCGGRTWSPSFTAAGGDAPRARCLQSCGGCRRPGTLPGGECGQRDPLWVTCMVSRELEGALGRLCEAHVWKGEAEPSGHVPVRLASGVHLPVSSHIRVVLSSEVTAGIAGPIQPPYIFLCDPFLSEAPVSPPQRVKDA